MKTEKQQSVAAAAFAKKWEGRGYEKGESQIFWTELLTEVMGVEDLLKTEDIHPPKTGISVHFSGSLV